MTDDLENLKAMMDAATPRPDPTRRAENITLAQKNFETLQGSHRQLRPTFNRPMMGLWTGVKIMLNTLTTRAGLTACTALVAVGLIAYTPLGDSLKTPQLNETQSWNATAKPFGQRSDMDAEFETLRTDSNVSDDLTAAGKAPSVMVLPDAKDDRAARESVLAPSPVERTRAKLGEADRATPAQPSNRKTTSQIAAPQSAPGAVIADGAFQPSGTDTFGRSGQDGIAREEQIAPIPEANTETFANEPANPLRIVTEEPVSTFSIDVDTASYAVIRNSLTNGQLPPQDAVRVEEMVNYFPYAYPTPEGGAAFRPTVSVSQTPWNPNTQLVHIAIQGAQPDAADRPPLNLVFLIDTSGSMNRSDKLPLLKQSFRLMLGQLRAQDSVAIVTYAGSAGQVLAPTPANERTTILNALGNLHAGGSTAGQAGLQQAYATAASMAEDGEVNRVILATDGDFNVGLSDPEALKSYIADKRQSGTYLSVLGFGRGNLDDTTMQALAQNGNGQAAYIDTLSEAQKVLVDQLGGALYPIADDVKIQVEFNPAQISEYRLIGYETRALKREDFNNDKVDAGDIGAGHQVTALYEVTPVGSPAQLSDPLRYGTAASTDSTNSELGFLRLRTKAPGAKTSTLIETPISADLPSQPDSAFAIAVAGFGQLLRGTSYLGDWSYGDAIALATQGKGADPFGYRSEAIQLMRLAQSLSAN